MPGAPTRVGTWLRRGRHHTTMATGPRDRVPPRGLDLLVERRDVRPGFGAGARCLTRRVQFRLRRRRLTTYKTDHRSSGCLFSSSRRTLLLSLHADRVSGMSGHIRSTPWPFRECIACPDDPKDDEDEQTISCDEIVKKCSGNGSPAARLNSTANGDAKTGMILTTGYRQSANFTAQFEPGDTRRRFALLRFSETT